MLACCAALSLALAMSALATQALAGEPKLIGTFDGHEVPENSVGPGGSFGGQEETVKVAVDEASGDVYVLDPSHDAVDRFDSSGKYLSMIEGKSTTAGTMTDRNRNSGIAVDNSGGPHQGYLYVDASEASLLSAFNTKGEQVWQVSPPSFPENSYDGAVAVDASGHPWVAQEEASGNRAIVQLDPETGSATGTRISLPESTGAFAFDNEGAAYVGLRKDGFFKYESGGSFVTFALASSRVWGVSTSFHRKDVFDAAGENFATQPAIDEWDKAGTLLSQVEGSYTTLNFSGIAVDGLHNRLYVGNWQENDVVIYELSPEPPTVESAAPTEVTTTGAVLHAKVNPNGSAVSDCHAEVVPDASFKVSEFATATSLPCSPPAPLSGASSIEVTATVTGLSPGTTYHTRFVAVNGGGTVDGADVFVKTAAQPAPTVATIAASGIGQSSATLNGTVNPNGGETTVCRFEYGTSTSYGTSVPCASVPGSSSAPVGVTAGVAGLTPATTYHVRLVAVNVGGTSYGSDIAFETAAVPVEKPAEKAGEKPVEKPVEKQVEQPKEQKLTRGQMLATAIKKCKKLPKRRRAACIRRAKKKYAPPKHRKHKK